MDSQKADLFLLTKAKYFSVEQLMSIRERLQNLDESKLSALQTLEFKNPTTGIILSLLLGVLGVDRFYAGDVGLGVVKLLTCGGLYVWLIIDYFMIMDRIRTKNFELIQNYLI